MREKRKKKKNMKIKRQRINNFTIAIIKYRYI